MSEELKEFFAVTVSPKSVSLYLVSREKENNFPIVEKIALRGESKLSVGGRLRNGSLVGIMKNRIILYDSLYEDKNGRPLLPDDVNMIYWGGKTSATVGLFLDKQKAMECYEEKNLRYCDSRWIEETEEALRAIGHNHSVFILSAYYAIYFK